MSLPADSLLLAVTALLLLPVPRADRPLLVRRRSRCKKRELDLSDSRNEWHQQQVLCLLSSSDSLDCPLGREAVVSQPMGRDAG